MEIIRRNGDNKKEQKKFCRSSSTRGHQLRDTKSGKTQEPLGKSRPRGRYRNLLDPYRAEVGYGLSSARCEGREPRVYEN